MLGLIGGSVGLAARERLARRRTQMRAHLRLDEDARVVEELIDGADTYEQEGPLTTFFQVAPDRRVIDCWSVRLMSIRTSDIASKRLTGRRVRLKPNDRNARCTSLAMLMRRTG